MGRDGPSGQRRRVNESLAESENIVAFQRAQFSAVARLAVGTGYEAFQGKSR